MHFRIGTIEMRQEDATLIVPASRVFIFISKFTRDEANTVSKREKTKTEQDAIVSDVVR